MYSMTTFTYLMNLEKSIDPYTENKIKKFEDKKERLMAKTNIDLDILREGLYNLGVTHDKFNHAYLSINISSKSLLSIGGINGFNYLQNVDVSYNNLTSLSQLSGLRHLNKLIVSNNKITKLFDFEAPENLEYADYSYNRVSIIQNINLNKYLKTLVLKENKILKIENLEENQYLEELDLSYNEISIIENLEGSKLQKLNLMNNKIQNITGLESLNNLIYLNLSKNKIAKLKGLQHLSKLRYLHLCSNLISRAKSVSVLSELQYLTSLDLCYNEVQNRKLYRSQIIFYLPWISLLDGQEVSHVEKVKADVIFGSDIDKKKEIFGNYLSDEEFVDRRLFVAEHIDPESDSEEEMNLLEYQSIDKLHNFNSERNFSTYRVTAKTLEEDENDYDRENRKDS